MIGSTFTVTYLDGATEKVTLGQGVIARVRKFKADENIDVGFDGTQDIDRMATTLQVAVWAAKTARLPRPWPDFWEFSGKIAEINMDDDDPKAIPPEGGTG